MAYDVKKTSDSRAILFFSTALKQAGIVESVSIGSRSYQVSDGLVVHQSTERAVSDPLPALRLAYEKALARRDPLMALPGVDPDAMERAVDELQETATLISKRQPSARDAHMISSALYPIGFLAAAAQLERMRQNFLESGSQADAALYRLQLYRTIRAYHTDIARYRDAFDTIVPESARSFVTPTETITRQGRFGALETLDEMVSQTETRASKRYSCLRGHVNDCDAADIRLDSTFEPETPGDPSRGAIMLAHDIRNLFHDPVGYDMEPSDRPLLELSHSTCIPQREGTELLYSFRTEPTNSGGFSLPIFVGDVFFIPSAPFSDTPYYAYFASNDVKYVAGSLLTYYTCQEADYDIGTLEAMRSVRDYARSTQLGRYAPAEQARALQQFEEMARSGTIVGEGDVASYLRTASDLVEKGSVPSTESNRITELLLEQRDRSTGIYKTILNINSIERVNMRLADQGVPMEFSPAYVFFSRSGFAALFMQTNRSVTGMHAPLFLPSTVSAESLPYVRYSDLLNDKSVRDDLIYSMSFVRKMHYE